MKLILLLTLLVASFAQAKIIKGDTLTISIKGVPQEEQVQINGQYEVSTANKIFLPYLTNAGISTSGVSTASLARRIEAAYRNAKIYTTPTISIQSLNEQKALAKKAGVSLKAVTNGEKGKSTLESMIAILIALEITEQLNFFIPKQEISPIQLAKLQGKARKRATGSNSNKSGSEETPSW